MCKSWLSKSLSSCTGWVHESIQAIQTPWWWYCHCECCYASMLRSWHAQSEEVCSSFWRNVSNICYAHQHHAQNGWEASILTTANEFSLLRYWFLFFQLQTTGTKMILHLLNINSIIFKVTQLVYWTRPCFAQADKQMRILPNLMCFSRFSIMQFLPTDQHCLASI